MKIIALKLITGEEVLGEHISTITTDDCVKTYQIKNPVGISIVAGPDGRPNVGFSPFPLHAEQKSGSEIDIRYDHVVYAYEPAEDFITNYDQIFGTGIVLPNKKLITG